MIKTMSGWLALGVLLVLAGVAGAAVPPGEHGARIFVDDKASGAARFSRQETGEGQVDQIRSEVAVKLLGFEVFGFTQEVEQHWEDGELMRLTGRTDDDGDIFVTDVARENGSLVATLNGEPVELPADAFPTSVWNYEITRRPVLFDVKDLDIRNVEVERSEEVLELGDRLIRTERFDFTKGWDATIWYDDQQRLVQFVYDEGGHEVKVVPEQCLQQVAADTAEPANTC
jgi:hypothetical protein